MTSSKTSFPVSWEGGRVRVILKVKQKKKCLALLPAEFSVSSFCISLCSFYLLMFCAPSRIARNCVSSKVI